MTKLIRSDKNGKATDQFSHPATLLIIAAFFLALHAPVVLQWWSEANGFCGCGNPKCAHPGKHPIGRLHPKGFRSPISDRERLRRALQRYPRANLGIVTGGRSRIAIVDIDSAEGRMLLKELERRHGPLPKTWKWRTGRGFHIAFLVPKGKSLRSGASVLGPGIDIKADGGMCNVPPSMHANGKRYRWYASYHPDHVGIATMPMWLFELFEAALEQKRSAPAVIPGAGITAGGRNTFLTRIAGYLRHQGLDTGALTTTIQAVNRTSCKPPLSDSEVNSISSNVAKYPVGHVLSASIPPPEPFPVNAFPKALRQFGTSVCKAMGCDHAMLFPFLLAVAAGIIGNTCRVILKNAWSEPAVIWVAVVSESGTLKSPALDVAVAPLREWQEEQHKRYLRRRKAWEAAKQRDQDPGPEPPMARLVVSDQTIEALVDLLADAPFGLILVRDELAGWFCGFNMYKSGAGAEESHWLEAHRAGQMVFDRKTGDRRVQMVPRAAVSVVGGIQPGVLAARLHRQLRDNGFAARILMAMPPRRPKTWTEEDIALSARADYAKRMRRLFRLRRKMQTGDGSIEPREMAVSGEARELWVAFFDSHNQEAVELAGDLGAAYSKLEGYCARIALVLELVEWAFDDRRGPVPKEISGRSMARAIELTGWFKHEAKRVYAMLEGGRVAEDPTLKAINAAGGSITARDLARSSSRFKVTAEAEQELERLVRAGLGNWERVKPGAKGGRPTRRFRLNTGATSNL